MSFILDALRKSDARRQQGGAPGLNSPEPPRPPRRRRPRIVPVLATVLLVFAVTAAAVYVVRPDWLPQQLVGGQEATVPREQPASPEPIAEAEGPGQAGGSGAEEPPQQLAQEAAESGRRERSRQPTPPVPEDSAAAPEDETAQEPQRDRRAPIPASPERTVRRESPRRESAPIPSEEATRELERRLAHQRRRRSEAPTEAPTESDDASPRVDREPQQRTEPARRAAAEPRPLNEGVAEYLRQWELPLSIRRNLPELNLTIHVFSPVEAERFVLINGERYVPGDSIGEAQIVDISRDGAIVDFRSHRFLLEPR